MPDHDGRIIINIIPDYGIIIIFNVVSDPGVKKVINIIPDHDVTMLIMIVTDPAHGVMTSTCWVLDGLPLVMSGFTVSTVAFI